MARKDRRRAQGDDGTIHRGGRKIQKPQARGAAPQHEECDVPACANKQHPKFAAAGLPLCMDCGITLQQMIHFWPKIPGILRQMQTGRGASGERPSGLVVVRNVTEERAALADIAKGMKG